MCDFDVHLVRTMKAYSLQRRIDIVLVIGGTNFLNFTDRFTNIFVLICDN